MFRTTAIVALLASLLGSSSPCLAAEKPVLSVAIAIPAGVNGKRTVAHAGPQSHFHVVVTNVSDVPQRLWKEWCSWGYYALAFETKDGAGKAVVISKKLREWTRNFPDLFVLEPGEHHVYDVYFGGDDWEGFPLDKRADGSAVFLTAVFEIKPDDESAKSGVWFGRVTSRELPVTLYNRSR